MTHVGVTASGSGATYVFAVCQDGVSGDASVSHLPGMPDGGTVRVLPAGALSAVVQTVRAADYTDDVWQERLADRPALEAYARAHHAVVSAVAAGGATVPLPLATLYHDDGRVRRTLTEEAGRFHTALRRVAQHSEWGVKVYAVDEPDPAPSEPDPAPSEPDPAPSEPDPAPSEPATAVRRAPTAPGAGLAYLNRKRGIQERRERRREQALHIAESVAAELQQLATASRKLRSALPDDQDPRQVQVLNATYLVAEHRAAEFAALAGVLGERTGTRIELSGPWVPYSFVSEV
ncbi:GvpL/GvpF family gas vesicle protein [Streptomyces sp. NPDC056500]|uniref:GvpL/GvpF family gas vesicle protein n=1 Tax=Streptomyces sp. NPDC056500 TaxID=3345840 RepID=UPI0036A6B345